MSIRVRSFICKCVKSNSVIHQLGNGLFCRCWRYCPLTIVECSLLPYRTIITGISLTQEWVWTFRNVFLILFRFLHCLQIHHYKFQFNQSFLALRDKKIKIIKEVRHNMQLTSLTFHKCWLLLKPTNHCQHARVFQPIPLRLNWPIAFNEPILHHRLTNTIHLTMTLLRLSKRQSPTTLPSPGLSRHKTNCFSSTK